MGTKTAGHIAGTTEKEAEILKATADALAAGGDPFGDDGEDDVVIDPAVVAAEDSDDDIGDDLADDDGDEVQAKPEAVSAEALEAIAKDEDEPAPQATPRYEAGDPAAFKAKRTELVAKKASALKDLMDGVIEPDAYSAIETEVAEQLEAMTVQRTLHEANVQSEQQTQQAVLTKIMASAKKTGEVDYSDPKAARQFDTAMRMLADDGEARSYAELAADAHKTVLAIRGVTAKAAEAPAKAAAAPRENGKGPMTLRTVPAAATPNTGGGWKEVIGALQGQDYERAYAALSPAQKAALLDD